MSYADDLKIDRNDLVSDWEEQPVLMLQYCDLHAEAVFNRDADKIKLDYTEAKLDSEIRKDFKAFGFVSKPTEAAIKNTILLQKEYIEAIQCLLDSSKQANLMSGIRQSFDHRKKALENMVTLLISGFHSEPRNKVEDIKKLKNKKFEEHHEHNKKILKGGKRNKLIKQSKPIKK